jgi:hypothetical protein
MEKPIKILHIDLHWNLIYLVVRKGSLVKTSVSTKTALSMVKQDWFDLIISEPQHKAILTPRTAADTMTSGWAPIPTGELTEGTRDRLKAFHHRA